MFLLKHWDRKNKFRIFFHKMPTSQELIPKNTSFFMPQLQKYAEWNSHFCAAHLGNFFTSKQVDLSAHEHKIVRKSINSDDTNLSSIGFAE